MPIPFSIDTRRRLAALAAGGVLLIGAALPSDGTGVPFCICRSFTGVPCPGCGLTRSTSCFLHADLAASARYHPFGPAICLLLIGIVAWGCLPRGPHERLDAWARRRRVLIKGALVVFFASLIVFGVARAVGWLPDHTADTAAIARSP